MRALVSALIIYVAAACTVLPSGPAADLYRERPDTVAIALSKGDLPAAGPDAIEPYLDAVAQIPRTPIESGDPLIDDIGKMYAKLFEETVAIVQATHDSLQEYPDVGSFIAANWALSPSELRQAIIEFDVRSAGEPLSLRLERYYGAQADVFYRSGEVTRILSYEAPRLFKFSNLFVSGGLALLSKLGGESSAETTICINRKCTTRPTKELHRLRDRALRQISNYRQAIANGNAYIEFYEKKLEDIMGATTLVILPGANLELSEITKREQYNFVFRVRSVDLPVQPRIAWSIVIDALEDQGHVLDMEDERTGLMITNLARHGFLASVLNATRYYTKYYVLVTPSPITTLDESQTRVQFKRFVYKPKIHQDLSPISAIFKLKPVQKDSLRTDMEEEFIQSLHFRAVAPLNSEPRPPLLSGKLVN